MGSFLDGDSVTFMRDGCAGKISFGLDFHGFTLVDLGFGIGTGDGAGIIKCGIMSSRLISEIGDVRFALTFFDDSPFGESPTSDLNFVSGACA